MNGKSSLHILALTGGTYFDILVPLKNVVYNKCYVADFEQREGESLYCNYCKIDCRGNKIPRKITRSIEIREN